MSYFIKPDAASYASAESRNYPGSRTYSEYNYLTPGIASAIKTWHFEKALSLTKDFFHSANVIDFGCADGVFLPSLSRYFNHVCAVDRNPAFVATASTLVNDLQMTNVDVLCNDGMTEEELKSRLSARPYQVLFLLETLEHVGDKEALYDSRIRFLKELLGLIDEGGRVVISVPNMLGFSFFVQRLGLALTHSLREPITLGNLIKASLLHDTGNLEKMWDGGHLGFNHAKLERRMKLDFRILKKCNIMFQILYVITAR